MMIELSRHIEILLLNNDCVIVPGLGGFMAHYIPAEYIDEEALFCPPLRTVGFNAQLRVNDSLLAQSYVEAYDISYPEAVRRLASEVEEVRQTLDVEGSYTFHGVGVLTFMSDGRYEFQPCSAGLLSPSLYALPTFAVDVISRQKNVPVVTLPTVDAAPVTDNVDCDIDVETADVEVEGGASHVHFKVETLRAIAVAAMFIFMFVFSSLPMGEGSVGVQKCSVIDAEIIASFIRSNGFSAETLNPHADSVKMVSKKDSKAENAVEASEEAEKKIFSIILASKVSREGAERFVKELKRNGMNDARVCERGSVRKVVYGKYLTESEAMKVLNELRTSDNCFAEAWVSEVLL